MINFETMLNELKTHQQVDIKNAISFLLLAEQYLQETSPEQYSIGDVIELAKYFSMAQK